VAADEPPVAQNGTTAAAAMTLIDLREIKVAGEIGRCIDVMVYKNLLALDFEREVLAPFQKRNKDSGYIGHGSGAATVDVVLTEFVDPSGIATYFRVPGAAKAADDELVSEK
jgi:hypothetical protein